MGYKIHFFRMPNGEIIRFAYCKMKRIGTKNTHCYDMITEAGHTYLSLMPIGRFSSNGEIEQDLEAWVLKNDHRSLDFKLKIGFGDKSNLTAYKGLCDEVRLISKPKIAGYKALKELAEEHRKYSRHLANCKIRQIKPTRTAPCDYDELAAKYPRAHLYIEAQNFQLSDTPAKQEAGRCAMKLLFEGSYAEIAKGFLDNWANPKTY